MDRVILWTDTAKTSFDDNIAYLLEDWTDKEIATFIDKTDTAIDNLRFHPYIGKPLNGHSEYRSLLVVPQISLVYRIVNSYEILLITFFNNYQNPYKLEVLLS
ncbi:type II toxin-antitoxin system RelE/ParE family toxin [Riemerella anatipestifer]|uniref:type II toxin-antitoxin system RelE/ParE family toxin n=1 Tax=Riemerella anatipestifer TaxID=34085 RepID=UPI0021D5B7DF|nr:type II toxin-antitoxin system RelE/ParE family toxin [Riemerella anatipestifer]MCU7541889.1 type II toxin-antitoxin system RelE/ParE family toxin [Riemerella anatipestifer]MCW0512476.1 type II toxin-antitoxin system RelE/ParE family toxin [Riemerella anatipestifer]